MKNGAKEFFAEYNITPADELDYSDTEQAKHRHVSIDIAGRTITLDLIAFEDHISIDVRAFGDEHREDSTGLPIGVFGIEKGISTELPETGHKAHGWNAFRMPILLVATEGHE